MDKITGSYTLGNLSNCHGNTAINDRGDVVIRQWDDNGVNERKVRLPKEHLDFFANRISEALKSKAEGRE